MELLGKLSDAASMFWQALDDRERMLVVYGAAWFALVIVAGVASRQRDRLKAELREELLADAAHRA